MYGSRKRAARARGDAFLVTPKMGTTNMREGTFNIHAKGYPEAYHGTELKYNQGATVAEIVSAGHAESEEAIVRAFYGQFNIRASAAIKEAAAKGATKDELAAILQNYKILTERKQGGGGGNPEALAKARETREKQKAAANKLDTLRQAAANDPKLAAKLASLGID